MRVLLILLLVLFVDVQAVSARKRRETKVTSEGNHTVNEATKGKIFTLKDLRANAPLAIVLKSKSSDDKGIDTKLDSPVNVTITDDHDQKVECSVSRMNQLCLLEKVKSERATKVELTCKTQPCDVLFDAFQSEYSSADFDAKPSPLQVIYNVDKDSSIVQIRCNDSSIDNLRDKLKIYSEESYEVISLGNLVYAVFDKHLKNLAVMASDPVRKCSEIQFFENTQTFDYGKVRRAFVMKTKKFSASKIPTKELRVDMTVTDVNQKPLKNFTVEFLGVQEGKSEETSIHKFTIGEEDEADQDPSIDINLILKGEKFKNYKSLFIKITSPQNLLLITQFNDENKHEIDVQEQSYLSLQKDEKVEYKIMGVEGSDQDETIEVTVEPKKDFDVKLSQTPCRYSKGCSLTVTAKANTEATIYTSLAKQKAKEVNYLQIKSSLALTLNQGQTKYLIHNSTTKVKSRMIRVSTPNVILYAAGNKCPQPSSKCYEYSGNVQKAISIENNTGPIYMAVTGLELVKFTIFISEGDGMLELLDGVPMPINMQKDKQIYMKFKIDSKKTVNFNLIAPPNNFAMYVSNSEEMPDSEDVDLATSSSFIKFSENDIDGLTFTILIKRLIDKQNENFILIVSTSQAVITLGRSQPHYDLLQPQQSRTFAVLINPNDLDKKIETILSLSIFQKIEDTVNLSVTLAGPNNTTSKSTTFSKRDNILTLNDYADEICDAQDSEDQCDVFITVMNNNKQKIDITLTVLTNNSIIELKPGIWQRYEMTSVTSSSHFYFFPTNKKYPVTIQFTHSYGAYRISFVLWNDELKVADAGDWPFPETTDTQTPTAHTGEYVIHPDQISKCFPNCLVLISLWNAAEKPNPDPNVVAPMFNNFGSYSIMAADNIIEVAEEQKVTISLAKDETKFLLVSLTPFLETDRTLTFMCSDVVGYHSFTASLSSNKNLSLPTEDEFDYRFELYESQLKMEDIKKKLQEKGMDTHTEIDLIIFAKGFEANKFVFEFTSRQNYMSSLSLGVPQSVSLAANTTKGFLVDYFMSYRMKLIRRRGFPFVAYKACKRNRIPECLDELSKLKPLQITSKAQQFRSKNCDFCVLVVSVQAKQDPVEADLIALSDFAVVQINQGEITTDFAIANQTNQYKVTVVKGADIAVTVTVFEGEPQVTVENLFEGINITGKRSGNLIHIVVPSSVFNKKIQKSQTLFQSYALSSVFSEVTIKVRDPKMNCSYSISYTLGERHIDILDGVLVSSTIKANDSVSYSYHNWQNSTAIVSLTFNDTEMLESCQITIYSSKASQQPQKTKPEKMEIKKRTPKPSLTFSLNESYSDYEIKLGNKHAKQILFNLTINHVDIVLLPFGYEYPSSLYMNESAYFIVEVFNDGYIQFIIKKCSDSDMTFQYALDDESFEKEDFAYTTEIQEARYSSFVHVKASTIFLKINSNSGLLYSIKAAWYAAKKDVPKDTIKPGNKGLLDYSITGSQEFTVTFSPIVCTTARCPKVQYYYLMSSNRDEVVSQSECPGSFFLFTKMKSLKHERVKPEKGQNNTQTFKVKPPPEVTYLGLKAVLDDGQEITYNVIELSTIWTSLAKNRSYHLGMLGMTLLCCFFCCCMKIRKLIRETREKGKYAGLPEVD